MNRVRFVIMIMVILMAALFVPGSMGCGGGSGGGTSGSGGFSSETWGAGTTAPTTASATPQVTSCINLTASGQALRSGDWCQVNGSGFGASKDVNAGSVVFTDGILSVPATLYYSWSDTVIVLRVPDGIPAVNVMIQVVTLSGASSAGITIPVSTAPNPSPQATPPQVTPTPTPTTTPTPGPAASPTPAPTTTPTGTFILKISAFENGGSLPVEYTGDGAGATVPLEWSGAPEATKSYALIMHHIDPEGMAKWYWIIYNIPSSVTSLPQNVTGVGILGNNSVNGLTEYAPPHSSGPGAKTYIYTVYALSAEPVISVPPAEVNREVLLAAMQSLILATAELQVIYTR